MEPSRGVPLLNPQLVSVQGTSETSSQPSLQRWKGRAQKGGTCSGQASPRQLVPASRPSACVLCLLPSWVSGQGEVWMEWMGMNRLVWQPQMRVLLGLTRVLLPSMFRRLQTLCTESPSPHMLWISPSTSSTNPTTAQWTDRSFFKGWRGIW